MCDKNIFINDFNDCQQLMVTKKKTCLIKRFYINDVTIVNDLGLLERRHVLFKAIFYEIKGWVAFKKYIRFFYCAEF